MAKKFLYVIAAVIILALIASVALSVWGDDIAGYAFQPSEPFEEQPALSDNAYADRAMWFARPGKQALVKWLPRGFDGEDADRLSTPVFFVHPTTYLEPEILERAARRCLFAKPRETVCPRDGIALFAQR